MYKMLSSLDIELIEIRFKPIWYGVRVLNTQYACEKCDNCANDIFGDFPILIDTCDPGLYIAKREKKNDRTGEIITIK